MAVFLLATALPIPMVSPSSAGTGACFDYPITLSGTPGKDKIEGTNGTDVIIGLGGADIIKGLGGDDVICGGDGKDKILGGNGSDNADGGDGGDYVLGGGGDDYLYGDWHAAGTWDDVIDGGTNSTFGGDWILFGYAVSVNLEGGTSVGVLEGQDTLRNIENVDGSDEADTIIGDDNPNYLVGRKGNDVIWGRDGNDAINGHAGNDALFGGGGTWDWLAYFDATDPVNVDLQSREATSGADSDEISGFELVIGSDFDDHLKGDARPNYLAGRGGNDTLDGRDGFDIATFYNSANADLAAGLSSSGNDPLPPDPPALPIAEEGEDTLLDLEGLWGSPADDILTGNGEQNILRGDAGSDLLSGLGAADYFLQEGGAADAVHGGDGSYDLVDYSLSPKAAKVNLATESDGGGGEVIGVEGLLGSRFKDVFKGDSAPNYLFGDAGNDTLRGQAGNDALAGGKGKDDLAGGADEDRCIQAETSSTCEVAKAPPAHPLFVVGESVARAERRYKRERRYK
ncbi:MAG: hypothetical protein M3198_11460 [Actinomycetota bacterium]|nr:hypothetical protein [Actinomycetota bacterium]